MAPTTTDDPNAPRLLRRLNGGWLAVSGPGAEIRIGVEAETADEARKRFAEALQLWGISGSGEALVT